ncbi:hypothetical protein OG758_19455 [Streptomyces sp. NBC_01474]|uniref:hypothetical protein n=1 Tax=unclassified Streptomyces TaxID=2593676 RepID=UPI002DDB00A3|nr:MULTISPECIES: hypothetical protein [unclassified Streptomyces]WSD96123.1 hypothetical protein OG758_19455 [Streptomyces sp. NBC_01474]
MQLAWWAHGLAESLSADRLPRRWAHSRRVQSQALNLAPTLGEDAELLAAAAIARNIGSARAAADTEQHMIDGARCCAPSLALIRGGAASWPSTRPPHGSHPKWEPSELGLDHALNEFGPAEIELVDTITY